MREHQEPKDILLNWLRLAQNSTMAISRPINQEKARKIACHLNTNFLLPKTYNHYRQISGESESVSVTNVSKRQNKVLSNLMSL